MGSFATSIALVLSMNNVVGSVMLTRNYPSRPRIATAWHAASELETISASNEESATVFCLRVDQATAAPQYRKTWPLVEWDASKDASDAPEISTRGASASVGWSVAPVGAVYVIDKSVVSARYRRICWARLSKSGLGYVWSLVRKPTAAAMLRSARRESSSSSCFATPAESAEAA